MNPIHACKPLPPLTSITHLLAVFLILGGIPVYAASKTRDLATDANGVIQFKGLPKLQWKAAVRFPSSASKERILEGYVEGSGLSLQGQLKLGTTPGMGRWTLDSATLPLQTWLSSLANLPEFRDTLGDLTMTGELRGQGSGTLIRGNVNGRVDVRLSNATLASESRGLHVTGIDFSGEFEGPVPFRSTGFPSLTFTEANFSGIAARMGHVDFAVTENREIHIKTARVDVLGGTVDLRDESLPLEAILSGDASAAVHLSNLNLKEISALLPDVIAEARGRVSGEIRIGWKPGEGFRLGNGRFQIERPESVEIRFTPQPGFLTAHTPERLTLLPSWTGPLQKWFSPRNPAYETLRQIEMGLMSLQVETLSAEVHPEGDALGRSATVRISARPAVASAVDRIDFEVNVSGPLDEVIKLGMNQKISIRNGSIR